MNHCKKCPYAAMCLSAGELPWIKVLKTIRGREGFSLEESVNHMMLQLPEGCYYVESHPIQMARANRAAAQAEQQ